MQPPLTHFGRKLRYLHLKLLPEKLYLGCLVLFSVSLLISTMCCHATFTPTEDEIQAEILVLGKNGNELKLHSSDGLALRQHFQNAVYSQV